MGGKNLLGESSRKKIKHNSRYHKQVIKKLHYYKDTIYKGIKLKSTGLIKDVQDLYTANCGELLRNINGDANNWNGIILLWIRRFNIFNLSTLSHRFNIIQIKIPSFLMMLNFFPCMLVT